MKQRDLYVVRQPVWLWVPIGIVGAVVFGLAVGAAIICYNAPRYSFTGTFNFLLLMGGPIIVPCVATSFIWFWRNRSNSFTCDRYVRCVPAVSALILVLFPIPFVLLLGLFWEPIQYVLKHCHPSSADCGVVSSLVLYIVSTLFAMSVVYPFSVILAFIAALPSMLVLPVLVLTHHAATVGQEAPDT